MTSELISSGSEYARNLQKILQIANRSLCIFDEDLSTLKLESRDTADLLRRLLACDRNNTLQIVLRNAGPFQRKSPRLMKLLRDFPAEMKVWECAQQHVELKDSLLIADACHALVRFDTDQARSKAIFGDEAMCRPYALRFSEIVRDAPPPLSATTLGL
jgi:hypothetical protein